MALLAKLTVEYLEPEVYKNCMYFAISSGLQDVGLKFLDKQYVLNFEKLEL